MSSKKFVFNDTDGDSLLLLSSGFKVYKYHGDFVRTRSKYQGERIDLPPVVVEFVFTELYEIDNFSMNNFDDITLDNYSDTHIKYIHKINNLSIQNCLDVLSLLDKLVITQINPKIIKMIREKIMTTHKNKWHIFIETIFDNPNLKSLIDQFMVEYLKADSLLSVINLTNIKDIKNLDLKTMLTELLITKHEKIETQNKLTIQRLKKINLLSRANNSEIDNLRKLVKNKKSVHKGFGHYDLYLTNTEGIIKCVNRLNKIVEN